MPPIFLESRLLRGYGLIGWGAPGCRDPRFLLDLIGGDAGGESPEIWKTSIISIGRAGSSIRPFFCASFRADAKHRTRNLEIPGLVLRTIPE